MSRTMLILALASIGICTTVHSQVAWQKQTGNPVFPAWSGSADDPSGYRYLLEPSVLFESDQNCYRMWFSSVALEYGSRDCISTALSLDGETWFPYSRNPVLRPGGASEFDNVAIYAGDVIRVGTSYLMYYSGANQNGRICIGLATSSDGFNWQKNPQNPVLSPGPAGSWDSVDAVYARVVFDGAAYHMWYNGYNGSTANVGYASSLDGVKWTKYPGNPVLSGGASGAWDYAGVTPNGVERHDSLYYMLYAGASITGGPPSFQAGLAVSNDGVQWRKNPSNPVLQRGSSGQWDDGSFGGGCLRFVNGGFAYWYTASSTELNSWQIGMATASLVPVSVYQRANPIPAGYALAQSYPNPFNPTVTIEYTLPREEVVAITIYDEAGRQVATLEQEKRGAGVHSTIWDATRVASGTFYYRMTAGNVTLTKKMVFLK